MLNRDSVLFSFSENFFLSHIRCVRLLHVIAQSVLPNELFRAKMASLFIEFLVSIGLVVEAFVMYHVVPSSYELHRAELALDDGVFVSLHVTGASRCRRIRFLANRALERFLKIDES